jgi:hypothetical protein
MMFTAPAACSDVTDVCTARGRRVDHGRARRTCETAEHDVAHVVAADVDQVEGVRIEHRVRGEQARRLVCQVGNEVAVRARARAAVGEVVAAQTRSQALRALDRGVHDVGGVQAVREPALVVARRGRRDVGGSAREEEHQGLRVAGVDDAVAEHVQVAERDCGRRSGYEERERENGKSTG